MNELEFNQNNADALANINGIDATIATNISSVTSLPTSKEYTEAVNKVAFQFTCQWSEPKYQCPKCDGGMCKNQMKVLTSYPAKYEYQCNKCGHIEYQYM